MLRQAPSSADARVVQRAAFDCTSGASGPSLLGALIDAGASIEAIERAVETLGVGPVRLTLGRVQRGGVAGVSVRVRAPVETPSVRSWRQVLRLVEFVAVPDALRDRARRVLERIADAAGALAGGDPGALELHELNALAMLTDVMAVVAALDDLGVDEVTVGPVGVGSGELETVFGMVPLPGPLVEHLLEGFALHRLDATAELTTPTGAALLAELTTPEASPGTDDPGDGGPSRYGVGAGDRAHDQLVRVTLGACPPRRDPPP